MREGLLWRDVLKAGAATAAVPAPGDIAAARPARAATNLYRLVPAPAAVARGVRKS